MHKSVMKDQADNIIKADIYSFENKHYLVMMESVFQATSKEGGRGITTITGFNEHRISVYNLNDGKLVVRKKAGKAIKSPLLFLGCTKGNLWFYSPVEGIHTLGPETLEINLTHDSILAKSKDLINNLATCEWYELSKYFQLNDITHKIVLTDNKGYRYTLDTESLTTEKILGEFHSFEPRNDRSLETSISFPGPVMNIRGDVRKTIEVDRKVINPGLTFLEGEFIVDRNPARMLEGIDNRLSWYMIRTEDVYPKIMTLHSLNNGRGPRWGDKLRDSLHLLERTKNQLESDIRTIEKCRPEIQQSGYSHSYTQLLSPDTNTFFVFHKSSTAKEAKVIISRIELKNNKELKEMWNTEISELFFDPSAARETSIFKEVFSKGSPEFGFSYFDMERNNVIIIWMLHVHCIDIKTGKVLWKFRV